MKALEGEKNTTGRISLSSKVIEFQRSFSGNPTAFSRAKNLARLEERWVWITASLQNTLGLETHREVRPVSKS